MTYSAGGLIEASDYNGFAGGAAANVSGQLNTIWSTGYGNAGYGQSPVSNVSVAAQVTAAQWSTLVGTVNAVRKHQSGSGFTNLSLYVSGDVINATNDVGSNLTTAYTNRTTADTVGTTYNQPTQTAVFSAPNQTAAASFAVSRTATFGNSDQARYFFNAGGTISLQIGTITNTGGTARGEALGNLIGVMTGKTMSSTAMSAITTPAPFSEDVDLTTNYGYYGQSTGNLNVYGVSGSNYGAAYSSDTGDIETKVTGTAGSNGGLGETITFSIEATSAAQSPALDDSINISVQHYLQVKYPTTLYLANTWGSVTFG